MRKKLVYKMNDNKNNNYIQPADGRIEQSDRTLMILVPPYGILHSNANSEWNDWIVVFDQK